MAEIEEKYGISRQTLYNWEKKKLISKPNKNGKNHRIYSPENEEEIKRELFRKSQKNYTELPLFEASLKIGNRRYLGSKQKLLGFIDSVVETHTNNVETVADVFAGTGVVAAMFNKKGKKVIVNDLLFSNAISAETWFGNEPVDIGKIERYIYELNGLEGIEGYVFANFGNRYFSLDNSRKIDSIREKIESISDLNDRERAFLITSLLYAADKVANTVGHYDAFRKKMDSYKPIYLRVPELNINTNNEIYNEDANQLVRRISADLVYIDTPYNSRGYESAYHLLENIAEWKKPEVEGVAKKAIDRSAKSSEYTKKNAPKAFDDLIQNIKARYILVSYNNMAEKGNSRSNAKISNEEIIEILEKKGKVKVLKKDFSAFTTGKSKITNHKELLYLCEVESIKKEEKNKYIKSALNYTGGKFKLLPQLLPLFPQKYKGFVDLFSGGATVGVNVAVNTNEKHSFVLNDYEKRLISFFRYLSKVEIETFIERVEKCIADYGLSNTYSKGYEHYGAKGSEGLSLYNKLPYLRLREDYNMRSSKKYNQQILFYLLIVYGFNNQIRFNRNGYFNLPVGKRDFNKSMREKLIDFHLALKNNQFRFSSTDFRRVSVGPDDFVYADPPYRISNAAYNESDRWNVQDDLDLFAYLDKVDKRGAKFALSNVATHKNSKNIELMKWASKYNIHILEHDYNNSNYQSKAKYSETVEVLITNYQE